MKVSEFKNIYIKNKNHYFSTQQVNHVVMWRNFNLYYAGIAVKLNFKSKN